MPIIAFNTHNQGQVGDTIEPRRVTMVTTDNLATITTAGYLNNQNALGNPLSPTDIIETIYNYNPQTKTGTLGFFQVLQSLGSFTLEAATVNPVGVNTNAVSTFAAGAGFILDKAPATVAAGAVTLNKQSGVITTTALTTAAGSSSTFTLTDSEIKSTSVIIPSWQGGTNTNANFIVEIVPANGSAVFTIFNNAPTAALNGTISLGFAVF
jgi:hypothetical protein